MLLRAIKKALLNISVDVSDPDCSKFLWVNDISNSSSSVVVYQFC